MVHKVPEILQASSGPSRKHWLHKGIPSRVFGLARGLYSCKALWMDAESRCLDFLQEWNMDTKHHISAWHIVHLCIGCGERPVLLITQPTPMVMIKLIYCGPSLHHALITYMYMSLILVIGHDVAISSTHVRHLTHSHFVHEKTEAQRRAASWL